MNILWYILHARQLLIIQASISLLTRFFCSSLVSQLVVNWWFELVIWILRVPLSNNPFHFRGSKHIHTTKLDVSGGQEEVHERKRRWEPWPKQEKKTNMFEQKNVHLVQMLSCFAFPLKSWRIFQVQCLLWICVGVLMEATQLTTWGYKVGPNTSENSRVMEPFFNGFHWGYEKPL